MKRIFISAIVLAGLFGTANAQEKMKVHSGNESYVTTIEYMTFDATESDEVISLSGLKSKNSELTTANTQLRNEQNELNTQVTTLTNINTELTTTNTQLENEHNELSTQVTTLTNKNDELTTANTQLDSKNNELSTQVTTLTNKNDELTTANTQLDGENKELNTQVTTLTNNNAELTTANTQLDNEKKELNTQVTTLTNNNAELTTVNTQLDGENKELSTQVTALTTKNTELTRTNTQLRGEKTELETKVAQLKQQIGDLKKENGHEWVDLDLTSGTLWATCNVGADAPESYGNHYAWGEIQQQPDNTFTWASYKWCKGTSNTMTKYCLHSNVGTVDNKNELEDADDVAVQTWGGKWKMPTYDQLTELRNECYWVWTETYNGKNVSGFIVYKAKFSSDKGVVVSKDSTPSSNYNVAKDTHIFLPAASYAANGRVYDHQGVNYWSRTIYKHISDNAYHLGISADGLKVYADYRFRGNSVRPVCPGAK